MNNNSDDDDDDVDYTPKDKSLFIFGRDVSKIPCFRNSLLYGIGGGLTMGLVRFMFTSKPLAATNFAVYSFSGITLMYWVQCRYKYSQTKFEMLKMQELMSRNALLEGTGEDQDLEKIDKPVTI